MSSGIDLFLERISFKYFVYAGISLRASVNGMLMFKPFSTYTNFLYLVSEMSLFFFWGNGRGGK